MAGRSSAIPAVSRQGIAAMVRRGASLAQAGRAFGVSRRHAWRIAIKEGAHMSVSMADAWPAADVRKLKRLWLSCGCSTAEIGQAMHRSKGAIVGKAYRLDLPLRPSLRVRRWTAADNRTLTMMWAAGVPAGDIAKKLSRTAAAVRGRRSRLGLPPRPGWGGRASRHQSHSALR